MSSIASLSAAFQAPIQSSERSVTQMDDFLQHAASLAQTEAHFKSLYLAMVQASGSGKTRFALELRRQLGVKVAYLCLRPEASSGTRRHLPFVRHGL